MVSFLKSMRQKHSLLLNFSFQLSCLLFASFSLHRFSANYFIHKLQALIQVDVVSIIFFFGIYIEGIAVLFCITNVLKKRPLLGFYCTILIIKSCETHIFVLPILEYIFVILLNMKFIIK